MLLVFILFIKLEVFLEGIVFGHVSINITEARKKNLLNNKYSEASYKRKFRILIEDTWPKLWQPF